MLFAGRSTPITVRLMLGTDPVNARLGQVIQAALEKGAVEVEGPKAGKGGHETHGAGEHDAPND